MMTWQFVWFLRTKSAVGLEHYLRGETLAKIEAVMDLCLKYEWYEGVLICEREIAQQGLHVENNVERFDL